VRAAPLRNIELGNQIKTSVFLYRTNDRVRLKQQYTAPWFRTRVRYVRKSVILHVRYNITARGGNPLEHISY
jgi:hypothetical protein